MVGANEPENICIVSVFVEFTAERIVGLLETVFFYPDLILVDSPTSNQM